MYKLHMCIYLCFSHCTSVYECNCSLIRQSNFCSAPRSADKHGLPNTFSVLSETFDTASGVLSGSTSSFLSKHSEQFMSLHVSDQYTGIKDEDRYYYWF